jgi:hypothetical protein
MFLASTALGLSGTRRSAAVVSPSPSPTYEGTEGALEFVCQDGALFVVAEYKTDGQRAGEVGDSSSYAMPISEFGKPLIELRALIDHHPMKRFLEDLIGHIAIDQELRGCR